MSNLARRLRRLRRRIRTRAASAWRRVSDSDQVLRSAPRCLVCGSRHLRRKSVDQIRTGGTLNLLICRDCRYVSSPDSRHDYAAAKKTSGLSGGRAPRCATVDEPGRETGMAELGVGVLKRPGLSVLVYGAGQSLDVHHIAKLPSVVRVAIGDLLHLRDDVSEFVDITEHATRQYDVVVASEVLEHFPDPWANFRNLFSYVKDDGILIAGTNIRDRKSMNHVTYLSHRGHVSYFSPESLRMIARAEGMHLDFRFPLIATRFKRQCKRYVIFSRSSQVMDAVADWFGAHVYAPSEALEAKRRTRAEVTIPAGTRV